MISNCTTTKTTYDALEIAFQGFADVRLTKRQCVKTMFDNLRMISSEIILEHYDQFKYINYAFALGWAMTIKKLCTRC